MSGLLWWCCLYSDLFEFADVFELVEFVDFESSDLFFFLLDDFLDLVEFLLADMDSDSTFPLLNHFLICICKWFMYFSVIE